MNSPPWSPAEEQAMRRALELARRGQGHVEPNPMVGAVVLRGEQSVGEGWHARFGGEHAEVAALADAGSQAEGATMVVTLEPCCHFGKTPPCTEALLRGGIRRVVVAVGDPCPAVNGGGITTLRGYHLDVVQGCLAEEANDLIAPFVKLQTKHRPWMIAKWAMTLDGKLASKSGDSQWISNPAAREVAHALRGRVDAIVVGRNTAERDDPLLTARPPGPRLATRIVIDTDASLPLASQLVATAGDTPLVVACGMAADEHRISELAAQNVLVWQLEGATHQQRLSSLLDALGQANMTNVLVEGGGELLGSLHDLGEIDEVHAFIAPKLLGGRDAPSPCSGEGANRISHATSLRVVESRTIGDNAYLHARRVWSEPDNVA